MSDYEESEPESEVSEVEEEEVAVPKKKPIVKKVDPVSGDEVSENGSDSDASSDNGVSDEDDDDDISGSDEDEDPPVDGDEEAMFNPPVKPHATKGKKGKSHQPVADASDEDSLHLGELDLSDDDDEDDLDGSQYIHQFDEQMKEQVVANFHPELMVHNYDEVEALTRVTRDAKGVIVDPLHRTLPFLTKYEKTRILGERAKQINGGAKPFVPTNPAIIDGYLIALAELEQKKIPFILRRPLHNGGSEYWKLQDLEILA